MAREVDVTIKGKNEAGPAFKQAAADAESLKGGIEKLLNPMDALKGAIAGLGLTALAEFFKSTVEEAAKAEGAWARVSAALNTLGISGDLAHDRLAKLFDTIQRTTRFSDDDAASAFADLASISGDYAGSVKNLTLVTDIAVARQIDLHTAATLVGRVMNGDTQMLRRYGIEVSDTAHAIDELSKKFSGFAERDAASLEGRLHALGNAWDDLKKKLGEALVGSEGVQGGSARLLDTLRDLAEWIDQHKEGIGQFVDLLGKLGSFFITKPASEILGGYDKLFEGIARVLGIHQDDTDTEGETNTAFFKAMERRRLRLRAEERANAAKVAADKQHATEEQAKKDRQARLDGLKEEASALADLRKAGLLTSADVGKALETLHALETELASGTVTDKQRVELAKAAKDARDAIALSGLAAPATGAIGAKRSAFDIVGGPKTVTAAAAPTIAQGGVGSAFQQTIRDATKAGEEIDTVNERIGRGAADAALSFSSTWGSAIDDVIQGHESLGAAIVKTARKAVGQSLAADGQRTMLKAAEAAAEGFTNPIKFLQAAKLFAVGTAELAAASLFSGGGGGGFSGGLSSAGIAQTQNDVATAGKVTVYLSGSRTVLDHNNPDDMASLKDALQQLAGNREIDFVVTA